MRVGIDGKLDTRPRGGWDHIVVAPGKLTVEASAPGRKTYRSLQIVEAGKRVTIAVPKLELADARSFGTPGIIATVGGGLIAASMAIGLHAKSRYDDARSALDEPGIDSAQREADVATGILVVGAVTAAVGAVLYFKTRRGRVQVAPATDGSVGLSFGGSY